MADTDLASITERLDRIERAVSRLSSLGDLVNPVDPPPDDLVRLRPDIFQRRLIDLIREIIIKGDPPPFDAGRFRGAGLSGFSAEARLSELQRRGPGWVADPPPEDFLNVRILDLLRRWGGGVSDPPPEDLANVRLRDLLQRIIGGGGGVVDPAPEDIGRLSKQEIETQIHKVNAEMVRLKSLEKMLNERLQAIGQG